MFVGMAIKANGAAIRAIRERAGISQKTLAERAGITQAAISLIEGGGGMRVTNLRKIADTLGVPLDAISTVMPESAPQAAAS